MITRCKTFIRCLEDIETVPLTMIPCGFGWSKKVNHSICDNGRIVTFRGSEYYINVPRDEKYDEIIKNLFRTEHPRQAKGFNEFYARRYYIHRVAPNYHLHTVSDNGWTDSGHV